MVLIRATSFFNDRSLLRPSVCPVASWNRRRNICSAMSRSWFFNSSSDSSLIFSLFISLFLPNAGYELRLDGQLVRCKTHRLASDVFLDAFHFKDYFARTNHRHPEFRCSFSLAHAGFRRLLGHGLVWEKPYPHLASALDETRHRNTTGFDLTVGDPTRLKNLQPKFAKGDL